MKVAFVGLGVMGFPMAGHLQRAGHEVSVFNRSSDKAARWVQAHGGRAGASVPEAVAGCEVVGLCVGNDDDVRGVLAEALPSMAEGGIVVDHTTTSAKLAREAAGQARALGRWFVDAPVSGGQAGAESGQLAKMVNQICIAGVVQGLAEAIHFAKSADLDTEAVFDAISKGAAQSWQMDNRWTTMVENRFDFGFAVDWMRKDLGLVLDEARSNGSHLALTALVDQFYSEVQAMGGRRWDTSSLAARLEDRRRPGGKS